MRKEVQGAHVCCARRSCAVGARRKRYSTWQSIYPRAKLICFDGSWERVGIFNMLVGAKHEENGEGGEGGKRTQL